MYQAKYRIKEIGYKVTGKRTGAARSDCMKPIFFIFYFNQPYQQVKNEDADSGANKNPCRRSVYLGNATSKRTNKKTSYDENYSG